MTTQMNSPVDLFHQLVTPAMQQLQTANLALMGWAQQECERLYRAGRTLPSIRRMEAIVQEERRHIGVSLGGGFQTLGLGVAVNVQIKLRVREGEEPLTVVEVNEVEAWLRERYQDAQVHNVNGAFWIEWEDNQAKVSI